MTMKTYEVLKNPNKILRQVSEPLSDAELMSDDIQKLIDDMKKTMKVEKGVGLAAPQIGKHIRLIIVETEEGPKAFVNPKIIATSNKMVDSEEGCLSIPGVYGIVKRHKSIKLKAKDRHGNPIREKIGGFPAIIFQHEIDHLNGVLFIDRAEEIIEGESTSAI